MANLAETLSNDTIEKLKAIRLDTPTKQVVGILTAALGEANSKGYTLDPKELAAGFNSINRQIGASEGSMAYVITKKLGLQPTKKAIPRKLETKAAVPAPAKASGGRGTAVFSREIIRMLSSVTPTTHSGEVGRIVGEAIRYASENRTIIMNPRRLAEAIAKVNPGIGMTGGSIVYLMGKLGIKPVAIPRGERRRAKGRLTIITPRGGGARKDYSGARRGIYRR